MPHPVVRWLLGALLLIQSGSLLALQPQTIHPDARGIPLGPHLQFLQQPEAGGSIEEIRQAPDTDWRSNEHDVPSFGFSDDTYWARFRLNNPHTQDVHLMLEAGYALLDDVSLYQFDGNRLVTKFDAGDRKPFAERTIEHRNFLFPITLPADSNQDFYLRVHTSSSVQFPLKIWTSKRFYENDQLALFGHGLYYGIVLVMALYNFFLFLRIRDAAYLFYVLYVVSFALTQMTLTGFSFQFLWPNAVTWNEHSIAVLTPLVVLVASMFIRLALGLQKNYPWFDRLLRWGCILSALLVALSMFLPYHLMIRFSAALAIVACLSAFLMSYYIWLKDRQKYAAYVSAAWTVFLLGTVFLALNKFGIVPRTFFTESAAQIGSAIEVILLSYALAERLNDANRERFQAEAAAREANERLLAVERSHSEELEEQVRQRTQELQTALQTVGKLNQELQELSNTDQLTGAKNRRFFDDSLSREMGRARRNGATLSLLLLDIDHFKQVNDTYGHLAGDECLRAVTETIIDQLRRPPDEVCRYGGEEIAIILPDTDATGAYHVAEKIRQSVAALTFNTPKGSFRISASLGVTSIQPGSVPDPERLIEEADRALYRAKRNGRNQVAEFAAAKDASAPDCQDASD